MKKTDFKAALVSLVVVLTLLLGGLSGCITITAPEATTATETPAATVPATETAPATPVEPINPEWTAPVASNQTAELPSIADVIALVKPSVVTISVTAEVTGYDFFNRPYTQEVEGEGSGWILDESGLIVTNNHVVEGADTITVALDDGRTFTTDSQAVYTDDLNDLAVVKIEAEGLTPLKVGDSSDLRVGDWVVAIGNSLGMGISATHGIVSQLGVVLPVDEGQTLYDLIKTNAAINPGNSGGPLVNLAGEVIGITSAKVAQIGVEGMGYAISIDTAMPILQELVTKGYVTRPWLGVELYTVNQLAIRQLQLAVNEGVLLTKVLEDSPAALAGLEAGDVIVSMGGESVADVEGLTHVLHAAEIGEPLDVTYWRGKSQYTAQVTPVESPPPS